MSLLIHKFDSSKKFIVFDIPDLSHSKNKFISIVIFHSLNRYTDQREFKVLSPY